MPFSIYDTFQYKRNHEQEYLKFISNLRQQTSHNNILYLSNEQHMKEIERSRIRNLLKRQNEYERIQQENNLLSKYLFQTNRRSIIDNKNVKYQQNLNILNSKRFQQRLYEHKRINNENSLKMKQMNNVRGQLITKEQCNEDWQRHINIMKKNCNYPENIDRFVSNVNPKQKGGYKWNDRCQLKQGLFTVILGLSG